MKRLIKLVGSDHAHDITIPRIQVRQNTSFRGLHIDGDCKALIGTPLEGETLTLFSSERAMRLALEQDQVPGILGATAVVSGLPGSRRLGRGTGYLWAVTSMKPNNPKAYPRGEIEHTFRLGDYLVSLDAQTYLPLTAISPKWYVRLHVVRSSKDKGTATSTRTLREAAMIQLPTLKPFGHKKETFDDARNLIADTHHGDVGGLDLDKFMFRMRETNNTLTAGVLFSPHGLGNAIILNLRRDHGAYYVIKLIPLGGKTLSAEAAYEKAVNYFSK